VLFQTTKLTNTTQIEQGENYVIKEKLNAVVAFSNIGRRLYQARLFQVLAGAIRPLFSVTNHRYKLRKVLKKVLTCRSKNNLF